MIAMSTTVITEMTAHDDGGTNKQSQHVEPKNNIATNINRFVPSELIPKDNNVTGVEDVMMKGGALAAASSASLATAAAAAACVNQSVVPGLMRVYESMTQTSGSTPSKNNNHNDDLSALSQQASFADYLGQQQLSTALHSHHQQQFYDPTGAGNNNMYYNPGNTATAVQNIWGNYDATGISIAIPLPYAFPSQTTQPYVETASADGNNIDAPDQEIVDSANNMNAGGRPVRTKRNVASAGLDNNNEAGVGYDSSADGNSSGRGPPNKSRRKSSKGKNTNTRSSGGGDIKNQKNDSEDKNDGRWSKRFTWPDDLHRDFVSAIFDVGLKHSSPSTVMEHMPPHEQITTERIKSHLQKYRLHRQKAKKEFMTSYQQTMEQIAIDGGINNLTSLAGGQVAAHLSYVSEHHSDPDPETVDGTDNSATTGIAVNNHTNEETKFQDDISKTIPSPQTPALPEEPAQDIFYLPKLTESEKVAPIGLSLGYLMGLFFTLRQQLDIQRQQESQEGQLVQVVQQEVLPDPGQQHQLDEFTNDQEGGRRTNAIPNPVSIQSSSRSNLEVNSLIKREMQSQMAFQNKMRALKQQELDKYSKASMDDNNSNGATNNVTTGSDQDNMTNDSRQQINTDQQRRINKKQQQQEYQVAGETGGADTVAGKEQNVSLAGEEDDFWNTSVVDDELFDFLMNS